jgi:hypothetical protein
MIAPLSLYLATLQNIKNEDRRLAPCPFYCFHLLSAPHSCSLPRSKGEEEEEEEEVEDCI